MDKFEEAWKENRHVWESTKNLAKAMYLAGQQSRQAELDQAYADIETFAQAHQRECDIKVQIANELKEKDKRIEVLENRIEEGLGFIDKFYCEGWLSDLDNAEKALRGEQ